MRTRKRKCGRERTPGRRRRHRGRGETRRAFRTLESENDGCGRAGEGQDAGLAAPSARRRQRRAQQGGRPCAPGSPPGCRSGPEGHLLVGDPRASWKIPPPHPVMLWGPRLGHMHGAALVGPPKSRPGGGGSQSHLTQKLVIYAKDTAQKWVEKASTPGLMAASADSQFTALCREKRNGTRCGKEA